MSEGNVLEELIVKMVADTSGLVVGMAKGAEASELTARRIENSMSRVDSAIAKNREQFKHLAEMIAVTLGVEAFAEFVKGGFEATDQMAKLSDKIGVGITSLYGLKVASQDAGVNFDTLTASIQKMEQQIATASTQVANQQKGFKDLGIDAKELIDLRPDEAFKKLADALNLVDNQAERTKIQIELFGRAGKDITNVLRMGSEGMEEAAKKAAELGIGMNRIDAAKAEIAVDTFELLRTTLKSTAETVANALAPYVVALGKNIEDAAIKTGGFKVQIREMVDAGVTGIGYLGNAIQVLKISWDAMKVVVGQLSQVFYGVADVVVREIAIISNIISNMGAAIQATWTLIGDSLSHPWDTLKAATAVMVDFVAARLNDLLAVAAKVALALNKTEFANDLIDGMQKVGEVSRQMHDSLTESIDGKVKKDAQDLSDILAHMFDIKDDDWVKKIDALLDNATQYTKTAFEEMTEEAEKPWATEEIEIWKNAAKAALDEMANAKAKDAPGNDNVDDKKAKAAREARQKMLQERLDDYAKFYTTEEKNEAIRYQDEQDKAKEAFELGTKTQEEQNLIMEGIKQDHQDRLTKIEGDAIVDRRGMFTKEAQDRVALFGGMASQLSALLQAGNSKNVALIKAARYAETIINTASAAMANYNAGAEVGGPYLGAAYAAIAIGMGAVQLAAISSATSSGGGSISSGGAMAIPPPPQGNQGGTVSGQGRSGTTVNVSLLDGPGAARALLDTLKQAIADGGTIGNITS